jgi:hypothetical protein
MCKPNGQTTTPSNLRFSADQGLGNLTMAYFVLKNCGAFIPTLHGLHHVFAQMPGVHVWYEPDI